MSPINDRTGSTLRVFTPAGTVGGVEEVGRQAHLAVRDRAGGADLHSGARSIAMAPRPRGPWMALTWKTHALVRLSHPRGRGPSALWLHGAELTRDDSSVLSRMRLRSLEGSELLLAVSPIAEQLLPDGVREHVQLVGPPIPDAPATGYVRGWTDEEPLRLLSIGRAVPRKGHDVAIEVAQLLARDRPVQLDIVGPGPDVPRLSQLALGAALPGLSITVHGRLPDSRKHELYAGADALLFLPRSEHGEYEGLGLVQLEAASHGCPSVVLDCGGSRFGVVPGKTGWVLPATANPAELAAAVQSVVGRPDVRRAAKRFARGFALEDWQDRVRAVMAGDRTEWSWPSEA